MFSNLKPLFHNVPAGTPIIIAGPCSAESRELTIDAARRLKETGIHCFRAGVWKPRTKPGGFEGIGDPALAWLAEVKQSLDMPVATEVANARHAALAVDAGIDLLWIGARTTANPFAVQEIADYLATLPAEKLDAIAVIVKNPVNPDLELWTGALQRIYGAGIRRLGAVHRGFSAYGPHIYRNPPEWRIPFELKRRCPELPLICDPSHIGGRRDLIEPLARQALEMNMDGLIVECHCRPDEALSDAAQQITPQTFAEILSRLRKPGGNIVDAGLDTLRESIDNIDTRILELLARRMEVAEEIGRLKKQHDIPVVQPDRYTRLLTKRVADARTLGLDEHFIQKILALIHEESVRRQLYL
ncbi:MAG: bifunctional 3-deoxy-7-phosphoheptulonate synthase/chorismate mutase type II [Muribaculaceae bacterium]|nr:bifunctional 3-deoxy-7-phosphoheptulonate synthase/chorismate mutase type II [Muribaculaceae bacterium]